MIITIQDRFHNLQQRKMTPEIQSQLRTIIESGELPFYFTNSLDTAYLFIIVNSQLITYIFRNHYVDWSIYTPSFRPPELWYTIPIPPSVSSTIREKSITYLLHFTTIFWKESSILYADNLFLNIIKFLRIYRFILSLLKKNYL
jgi:hypothetical protein